MDSREQERFFQKVVKGPEDDDCWIWVGAIGDDGYGRFAIRRHGREVMMRPQRLLYEHLTGVRLSRDVSLLHTCDVPICVHVTTGADSHLFTGDAGMNMRDREQKGRAGRLRVLRRGLSRKQLYSRSLDLRDLVLARGWDRAAISAVLSGNVPDQPSLFDWP